MKKRRGLILAAVLATAAIARAQPRDPAAPGSPTGSDAQIGSDADPPKTPQPPPPPPPAGDGQVIGSDGAGAGAGSDGTMDGEDPYAPPTPPSVPELPRRKFRHGPIAMPEVLTTPTGWLLPAAVIYSRSSLDTGGGFASDMRVGLGDVAEFGVAFTDQVRERLHDNDKRATRIQPYVTASFRLGVSENRLFTGQPGVALGFRKSFERNHDGYTTRIAELTLVASKHIGKDAAIHFGGAFWDASLAGYLTEGAETREELTFHDGPTRNQIRAFGGFEVRPLPRSQILVDLGWSPEFCYRCAANADKITLRPTLSWGVRYAVADFMNLEAGVRVPDIAQANLLDAQIFGQVTFASWALRRAVDTLK